MLSLYNLNINIICMMSRITLTTYMCQLLNLIRTHATKSNVIIESRLYILYLGYTLTEN